MAVCRRWYSCAKPVYPKLGRLKQGFNREIRPVSMRRSTQLSATCGRSFYPTARLPSPASSSGRPSRTCVERKTLASGIFPGVHVNHLYGLWLGSRNERIVVQQQNRFDYSHELTARHRFWHRDRYGQGIRVKAAILDQGITCQLFVFLKDRVNARIDRLK